MKNKGRPLWNYFQGKTFWLYYRPVSEKIDLYDLARQLQKREEAGNELLCAEHSGIAWVDKFAKT